MIHQLPHLFLVFFPNGIFSLFRYKKQGSSEKQSHSSHV